LNPSHDCLSGYYARGRHHWTSFQTSGSIAVGSPPISEKEPSRPAKLAFRFVLMARLMIAVSRVKIAEAFAGRAPTLAK
jgi:hypothetical protein